MELISNLKNEERVLVTLFGKEKEIKVFSTGDNCFDENGNYKKGYFDLSKDELDCINWFLSNVCIENYKKEIVQYCNEEYSKWSDKKITEDDVADEIDINAIAINIRKNYTSKKGLVYPEISFFGDCKCDEENGICIGFRDKKFLGINSQEWTL